MGMEVPEILFSGNNIKTTKDVGEDEEGARGRAFPGEVIWKAF